MRRIIFILPFLLECQPAVSGAWTLPKGEAQVIVTGAYSSAKQAFDSNGQSVKIKPFQKYELRGFGEYGLTDWATVVVQPELRFKTQGDQQSQGFGQVDFGARIRFWQDDVAVASLGGSISAPGQSDDLAPLNGGDTDWEMAARLLYGRGFDYGWRHGFADLQLGYRHRFSEPADELVFDLTLGLDVTEHSFAMIQSFNRLSIGTASQPFAATQEHKLALSAVYRMDEIWSVQLGVQGTAYGRDVLRERGAFLALWRKL